MFNNKNKIEHKILQLATYAGKLVLTSGGEIYRVENTISYIGNQFGAKIDSFATLTCIISSIKSSNGEVFTMVERIKSRSTDLNKINQVQSLLASIKDYRFDELKKELQKIENEKSHSLKLNVLAGAVGASAFSFLFKGEKNDFISAFISGALVIILDRALKKLSLNSFFTNLILGGVCAFISNLLFINGLIKNPALSTISSLMLLVPGVSFINSIRDIIDGDLVAGTSRITEVFMIGTAIALGAVFATNFFTRFGGALCFI